MRRQEDGFNWAEFLGRPILEADRSRRGAANAGKTVLLTGAGGSIGSALARAIFASGPRLLILLDHSEHGLHQVQAELTARAGGASHIVVLGDVCDGPLLADLFARHRPSIIYHVAAFKHVPLLEANPFAAVWNNAVGTYRVTKAAVEHHAAQLVMVSTDKAANPHSVMGATKRIAELVVLGLGNQETRMSAVRLGNVLGTQGSVVPLFLQQIAQGGPVTVTHPEVRRYFVTLLESIEVILKIALMESGDGIFVPEMGSPVKIVDLANYLIRNANSAPPRTIPIVFTGLRPGDKMKEDLISDGESLKPGADGRIRRVGGSEVSKDKLEAAMRELTEAARRRDLAALLEILRGMVPGYQPSSAVLEQLSISLAGARRA